jgi:hypothetical protein
MAPERELDAENLIALCSDNRGCDCHLLFGHFGSFLCYNPSVVEDAMWMRNKISARISSENQQDSVKDSVLTPPP